MNDKKQIEFIPFHAINEFMRNDFRLIVIRSTLLALPSIDRKFASQIDKLTRKHVKVAGFRNSIKAPATIKAVAMIKAFEKQPKLVAAILDAWVESKPELKQWIYDHLLERGWKLLPFDIARSKLPGFLTHWPEEDDYDVIYDTFIEANPQSEASVDETSLMVIWLSGRLPINKVSKAEMDYHQEPQETEE